MSIFKVDERKEKSFPGDERWWKQSTVEQVEWLKVLKTDWTWWDEEIVKSFFLFLQFRITDSSRFLVDDNYDSRQFHMKKCFSFFQFSVYCSFCSDHYLLLSPYSILSVNSSKKLWTCKQNTSVFWPSL